MHSEDMYLRARVKLLQLLGPGEGSIGFGGPSKGFKSEAFAIPDQRKVRIYSDDLVVSLDRFIVFAQTIEGESFGTPGYGKIGIQKNGLIESLDGFIVFALFTESNAFDNPG